MLKKLFKIDFDFRCSTVATLFVTSFLLFVTTGCGEVDAGKTKGTEPSEVVVAEAERFLSRYFRVVGDSLYFNGHGLHEVKDISLQLDYRSRKSKSDEMNEIDENFVVTVSKANSDEPVERIYFGTKEKWGDWRKSDLLATDRFDPDGHQIDLGFEFIVTRKGDSITVRKSSNTSWSMQYQELNADQNLIVERQLAANKAE